MTSDPVARYLSQRGAKFDRKNRMRLMKASEMLDTALRIYQRLGLTYLRLSYIPALFCLAAVGFVLNFVVPRLFTTQNNSGGTQLLGEVAIGLGMAVFIGGPLFLMGLSYTTSLVVQIVSDFMLGNPLDEHKAIKIARTVLPKLFIVNLKELCLSLSGVIFSTAIMGVGGYISRTTPDSDATAGIVVGIGGLGMCVGILIFLHIVATDSLAVPVAVLEGASARQSSKRSRSLLKKAGYHPSGLSAIWSLYGKLLLVAFVLEAGIYFFFIVLSVRERLSSLLSDIPGQALILRAFDLVPTFLVIWTLIPIWASVITIVYYERRVRLEGFDIDVLASEISQHADASRIAS